MSGFRAYQDEGSMTWIADGPPGHGWHGLRANADNPRRPFGGDEGVEQSLSQGLGIVLPVRHAAHRLLHLSDNKRPHKVIGNVATELHLHSPISAESNSRQSGPDLPFLAWP